MPAPGFGAYRMSTFRLSTIAAASFLPLALLAQVPQAISYQAVLRDPASGTPMSGTTATGRYVLRAGVPLGPAVYEETQAITTNDQGLFTVQVGRGTPVAGSFSSITWGSGSYFLEVSLDIGNTGSFVTMGTQELLSVPYALHAAKSSNVPDGTEVGQIMHWDGTVWVVDSGLYVHQRKLGIGVHEPDAPLALKTGGGSYKLFSVTGQPSPVGESARFSASLPETTTASGFDLAEEATGGSASRLFIQRGTGNIGIGTTAPAARLHTRGTSGGVGAVVSKVSNSDVTTNAGWGVGHVHDASPESDGSFVLFEDLWPEASDSDFNDAALRVMHGGNVGIGSLHPPAMLTVGKRDALKTYFETGDIPTQDDFSFRLTDSTGFSVEQGMPGSSTSRFFIEQGTGNVGIGTTTPAEKFFVHAVHNGHSVGMRVSNGAVSSNDGWTLGHVDDDVIPARSGAFALMEAPGSGGGAGGSRMVVMPGGNVGINEEMPYATLHVTKPASDPTEPISLNENTGIAMLGPLEQHLVMDSRSIQARHLLGGATSMIGSAGILRLQPLGGDLIIHDATTDASRTFTIKDDGRVGIGTASPDTRLHVNRDPADPSSLVGLQENTGIAVFGPITDNIALDHQGIQARHLFAGSTSVVGSSGLHLQRLGGDLLIHDGATTEGARVVVKDNGNVGIGVVEPTAPLTIRSNAGGGVIRAVESENGGSNENWDFGFVAPGTPQSGFGLMDASSNTAQTRLFIASGSGHVGIGNSAPIERLHVSGAVVLGDSESPSPPNGTIRYTGTDFEGRSADEWIPFDAGWRRTVSSNDIHHNARVGIGTSTPSSALDVVGQGSPTEGGSAASVGFIDSMVNLIDDREFIGLRVYSLSTGSPGGTRKNIGLYVSEVGGQASPHHNLAAVLNGNTVIGDLHPTSSLVGNGGTNVLAIQNGTAPSSVPSSTSGLPDAGVQIWSASNAMGASVFHVMNGNGDVITLAKQNPLYTADMGQVNPVYDASTAAIIENMRTRINQLETIMKSLGVLEP